MSKKSVDCSTQAREFYSLREVGEMIGATREQMYDRARYGTLVTEKVLGRVMVPAWVVDDIRAAAARSASSSQVGVE